MIEGTRSLAIEAVRRYHRLEIELPDEIPDGPILFVANHGFGSLFDLNVLATLAALDDLELERPVTTLVHQIAWTVGLGPLLEQLDCRPASRTAAQESLAGGRHVLVFPGGDLDAFKARKDKDRIVFGGRSGFARMAIEQDVPIVPLVTAGAGDTLLVLDDGQGLARRLKLDQLLRLKALPVSVTFPWGLNVGLAGFLPYLGIPVQLRTRVLPASTAYDGEDARAFASRIETVMQATLDELSRQNG
ncbi:1-acyl-sn-glycerol-3-phosphate acyltransferase [Nocardioides humi]|uniref:Lysophospholipid acyltransferase family protein n=1 Tax=Nocardioides humi TaxID=449461 RepID=A0ABN2BBX7_9ACTN|nr:1-acyl-sn-glycerol-3-phosphate acyltransferase [Nocardioides humi]